MELEAYGHNKISIHALREEGDGDAPKCAHRPQISIHALREEGDLDTNVITRTGILFLSTPSARRATELFLALRVVFFHFYPRPPRGGRPTR